MDPAPVAAQLDTLEGQAADFERRLYAHFDDRMAAQSGQARAVADRLEGAVGSKLAGLEAQAGRVGAKLVKNANRQLGQAYTYGYPVGMVYPTTEQALYGLQSGDYLGSMGLPGIPDSSPGSSWGDVVAAPVGTAGPLATGPDGTYIPAGPSLRGGAGNDLIPQPMPGEVGYVPPALPPPSVYVPPPAPVVAPAPAIAPAPAPAGVVPTGGFTPLTEPLFLGGGVTPPPVGAPPASTEQGICHCPPGWIAVSVRPGEAPYCYPGPLLPNIRLNDTYAPYGFDPCGGGSPLCQDGTVRPFSGTCGPTSPGPAPPPGTIVSTNTEGGYVPPGCPPGFHPGPGPAAGPPVLADVPPIQTSEVVQTADGFYCNKIFRPVPPEISQPNRTNAVYGVPVWVPGVYVDGAGPPSSDRPWDVVFGEHWMNDGADQGWQYLAFVVPRGYVLFADPTTGLVYASDTMPRWGCPVKEHKRQTWTGGAAASACVPDAAVPASCPVPELAHCGPELKGQLGPLAANDDDVCKAIADALAKIQSQNVKVSDWIGMQTADPGQDGVTLSIMKAILGVNNPIVSDLINRFAKWIEEFLKRGTNALGCDVAALLPVVLNRGVFKFINHWTGAVPEQLLTELDQLSHTVCQSLLPTVAEADRCYLADAIDQTLWECWVKAAGAHLKPAATVRDAGRERLNVRQTIDAFRKEYITRERFDKLLRQGGVIDDDDKGELWQVEQYWPNHTDVIQWMGKDAFDEETVATFGLDTDFEAKYTARAKHYGDGLGMDDEQARYHWRSHWRNIGPQTMIEGARRLRPGDVDAAVAVSPEDLKKALLQQDIQPYWVDRMIELGFRVVTREDAVRLYTLHQIEAEDLTKLLRDAGFKKDKAELLTGAYKVARDLAEIKASGVPTIRMAVRRYARGEMTANELTELAGELAYYPGQVEQVEQAADLARDMENRRLAIAGVKRRYTKGLIGPADAASELAGEGIDADEIQELMKWWDQIKKHTGKQVPAATLCTWRKSHLISASEQLAALMRLGYESGDAAHIVAQCTLDIANTAQRAQVKAEAQAMKAATQAAKSEAARAKARVRSNRTSAPSANGGSANGAAGH